MLRVAVNGFLFGACHLSPFQGWTNIPVFIVTGVMGVVFTILREFTGDTLACSTAHILNNALACANMSLT